MRARIFLADDHSLLLDAFKKLLEPEYEIVGTATDGRMMLNMVKNLAPDLVLMDIAMPNLNGFDAGEKLKKILPDVKLMFLTVNEDADMVTEAFRIGASGYLLKSSAATELFEAIDAVLNSKNYVSATWGQHATLQRLRPQKDYKPEPTHSVAKFSHLQLSASF